MIFSTLHLYTLYNYMILNGGCPDNDLFPVRYRRYQCCNYFTFSKPKNSPLVSVRIVSEFPLTTCLLNDFQKYYSLFVTSMCMWVPPLPKIALTFVPYYPLNHFIMWCRWSGEDGCSASKGQPQVLAITADCLHLLAYGHTDSKVLLL